MEEIIQEYKPNANRKYYLFMSSYIHEMMNNSNAELSLSVDKLIKDSPISKPTFYSYFHNTEDFYRELLELIAYSLPKYMAIKSRELDPANFLEFAFRMKLGVLISNIRKASYLFSSLSDYWKSYYKNAERELSGWYERDSNCTNGEAIKKARLVLNELVLHNELYYSDLELYKRLMIQQEIQS